jgi:hypothetical protein
LEQARFVESELRPGDFAGARMLGFAQRRIGFGIAGFGLIERQFERLLINDKEQVSLLDERALLKVRWVVTCVGSRAD